MSGQKWKIGPCRWVLAAAIVCSTGIAELRAEGAVEAPVLARRAFVLTGPDGQDGAALDVSRALMRAGFDVVRRPLADGADPRIRGGVAVVYATAAALTSDPARTGASVRGKGTALIVLEACGALPDGTGPQADFIGPRLRPETRTATVRPRPQADGECPDGAVLADGLTTLLEDPDLTIGEAFADVATIGGRPDMTLPGVRRRVSPAAPLVLGGGARPARSGLIIGDPVTALGSDVTATRVAPVTMRSLLQPIPVSATATDPIPQGGSLRILDITPESLPAAQPTDASLPQPSIIVGRLIDPVAEPSAPLEPGSITGTELEVGGFEAREQVRSNDPEAYARLVAAGAFDPAGDAMPAALQTALQRMGCYRLSIDGNWGNGSRAAVDRYYSVRGETPPTREAETALFRDVVLREDVACAAPTAAPATVAAPRTPRRPTTTAATRPRAPAPVAAPAPASPAAPASGAPLRPTFGGVFR